MQSDNLTMTGKHTYRPEIDGIRAIAVISVILYHAQITILGHDWFSGGFVGVDVFFVISGYLISKIIFAELSETGKFNLAQFYRRRARRILPALVVVMLVTTPFAVVYLLPADLVHMAQSQLASLAFASNIYFYLTATDYGAAPGLLMPFLHTWSLSIEEQFYLVFPAIAILVGRFAKQQWLWISGLLVLSLVACLLINDVDRQLAFFMPYTRAWELLAGSLLALRELQSVRSSTGRLHGALAAVGLALVIIPVVAFGPTTPHPGVLTLVPVLGTVILLAFAQEKSFTRFILSIGPVRYIGAISYSLYLWHYPVFALQRTVDYDFGNADKFFGIGLTVLLSVFSYHFVEQPFRQRYKAVWRPAAGGVAAAAALATVIVVNLGFPHRLDSVFSPDARAREVAAVAQFANNIGAAATGKPVLLILGDSYTTNWSAALSQFVNKDRYEIVSISYLGCDVQVGDIVEVTHTSPDYSRNCDPFRKYINDRSVLSRVEAVFLVSHRPFEYPANPFRFDVIRWVQRQAESPATYVFGNYFQLDGQRFSSCLNLMFHQKQDASICIALADYPPPDHQLTMQPLYPHELVFQYVDLIDLLCGGEKASCDYEWGGVPFMTDWNHLTATFLTYAWERILEEQWDALRELGLDNYLIPRVRLALNDR